MLSTAKRRYFEIWGSEEAQNAILKLFLIVLLLIILVETVALASLALRKPTLVAVGETKSEVLVVTPPGSKLLDSELKRLVRQYVEAHYNWDWTSIEKAHEQAARYVSSKFIQAFLSANSAQVKTVREKKVSERVYISGEIAVDHERLTARVPMDRVFSVDGIRATSPLTLDIQFEYGPRTDSNPEGVYITGEQVVQASSGQ